MDMEQVSVKSVWRNLKNSALGIGSARGRQKAMSINHKCTEHFISTLDIPVPCQRALSAIVDTFDSIIPRFVLTHSLGTRSQEKKKYQRKEDSYERKCQQCPFTCAQFCSLDKNWFDIARMVEKREREDCNVRWCMSSYFIPVSIHG